MAIEILKELDPKKVEAWDRIHDFGGRIDINGRLG